jgi:hypothetical protein
MLYVNDEATMSGMKIAMAINKYRESFFPDYPSMQFDFRGICSAYCFPESTESFTNMFGNGVCLQKIKLWGHEWRWRLSKKRNGNASVHLRLYHRGEKFAFHFKKSGFNDLATIEQVIEQMATAKNYVGLFPEVEPTVVVHKRLVNEFDSKTTVELLEEVNRRYKAENPDWPKVFNGPPSNTEKELAAILAA